MIEQKADNHDFLKDFQILEKIGQSQTLVFSIQHNQNEQIQALKFSVHGCLQSLSHRKSCQQLSNEFKIVQNLSHPNIIEIHSFKNQTYLKNVDSYGCSLLMEHALSDYLFYYNNLRPSFNKKRKMLHQIASALDYLHKKGISHNDVKIENILCFPNETYKLSDFGYANFQSSQQQNHSFLTQSSSWSHRNRLWLAPETIKQQNEFIQRQFNQSHKNQEIVFDEFKSDVFSYGVMLFLIILKGVYPYEKVTLRENDNRYRSIYNNNFKEFWNQKLISLQLKSVFKDHLELQSQFQNLIESMICYDPCQRISFQSILNHSFFISNIDEN